MAIIQITATTPQPPLQFSSADEIFLRGWYSANFVAGDGVTPVESGNGQSGFYYNIQCSINGNGHLVIPAFDIQSTVDSSNPVALFTGQLYINGAADKVIFGTSGSGWPIPSVFGSPVTYDELATYAGANALFFPPPAYFTQTQTIAEILRLAAAQTQNYAAVGILGLVRMSYAPDVASEPTALSINDPTVVFGAIGNAGVVPRANDINSLVDSQITDDGVDVGVQTLNYFQAGDYNNVQNGSYVSVNDNLGRANLFAGGNGQAEYAGIAGVCDGIDPAQVFVQATAYSYLFGQSGVVILGDGGSANNGTKITIDDVNQLIKLTNVPTSDPAVAGAIWRDGQVLKISDG